MNIGGDSKVTRILSDSLNLFSRGEKIKLMIVISVQFLLNLLDLVGVLLLSLLGTVAVTGLGGPSGNSKLGSIVDFLGIGGLSLQQKVMVLGSAATILLLIKTITSIYLTRRILVYLSHRGAEITKRVVKRVLSGSLEDMQKLGIQATIYSLTQGIGAIVLGIVGTTTILISDIFLLAVLFIGLLIIDPTIAFLTLLIFSIFGFALYSVMSVKSAKLGELNSSLSIKSNELILEALNGFRELRTSNRHDKQAQIIGDKRSQFAAISAEISFLPNYGKYLIEIVIIVGTLLVAAIQFSLVGASEAIGVLVLFMASAMRIAPAVLRVQQGFLLLRQNFGTARSTFELIEKVEESIPDATENTTVGVVTDFRSEIKIEALTFAYQDSEKDVLKDVWLTVREGEFVSIVGPSGSGKTTLIDLVLGLQVPTSGAVTLSGVSPKIAIEKWPDCVGYVPQDSFIANLSIAENIAFGIPKEEINLEQVRNALRRAELDGLFPDVNHYDSTLLGEHGSRLSGGQRQRIGIARALYSNPKILVLDEPTSALDSMTEFEITRNLLSLKGEVTILIIAHRLSTIRNSDTIVYLSEGKILGSGSFDAVRLELPQFDQQAKLLGL